MYNIFKFFTPFLASYFVGTDKCVDKRVKWPLAKVIVCKFKGISNMLSEIASTIYQVNCCQRLGFAFDICTTVA